MPNERLQRQVEFILEIDKLKTVLRQTYLMDGSRRENSAEHTWHLTVMALVLSEYANTPVNLLQVLKMLVVHDIVEIDAGDTYIYDERASLDKAAREEAAADRLFGLLPADQAAELRALWNEFEQRQTPEARFAAALDRLMPLLHNYHTQGKSWRAHGVTADRVVARVRHIEEGSQALWDFAQGVIEAAVAHGYLAPAARPGNLPEDE
ncbi:HD domain-containing protein [Candidatus Amarolinea aalborgensis]|jgi:putative hydrolase of HD superfamily|uniref:HD domain-containing protein n=1 Tax=Candidatus Amarolinea aalborgensis TaxID=2249329 RepID=UPI003BF959AD